MEILGLAHWASGTNPMLFRTTTWRLHIMSYMALLQATRVKRTVFCSLARIRSVYSHRSPTIAMQISPLLKRGNSRRSGFMLKPTAQAWKLNSTRQSGFARSGGNNHELILVSALMAFGLHTAEHRNVLTEPSPIIKFQSAALSKRGCRYAYDSEL